MAVREEGSNLDYRRALRHATKQKRLAWQDMFATKPVDWRYEREVRLLVIGSDESSGPLKRPYTSQAIRRIIVGERATIETKRIIAEIAAESFPHASVLEARISHSGYTIETHHM